MVEAALIVDSRFSSRRKLLKTFREAGIANRVVEAISVYDGLQKLESDGFETCVLGPGLSRHVALDFIREGKDASRNHTCAFIVSQSTTSEQEHLFLKAGAHAAIDLMDQPTPSFTDIVTRAVSQAKQVRVASLSSEAREHLQAIVSLQNEIEVSCDEVQQSLADVLSGISAGLRLVSKNLARGSLRVRPNGEPSLAARDAIRGVFESALSMSADITGDADFDRLFLQAVSDWFVDRVELSHQESLSVLRSKLIQYQR